MPITLKDGSSRGSRRPRGGGSAFGGSPSYGGGGSSGSGTKEDPYREIDEDNQTKTTPVPASLANNQQEKTLSPTRCML